MPFDAEISVTVGIPTYNRPEALIRRLRELEKIGQKLAEVIICDNSDQFNQEADEICGRYDTWQYIKNPENLGFGPNLLRVLELAETTHLWWRGDDDVISQVQAAAVTSADLVSDEILILDPEIEHIFTGKGLEDFCRNFAKIQSMGWMSALVVPTKMAKGSIEAGLAGIPSGYPHFSLVLNMLEENPHLKFRVVPFKWELNEFRDVGEKEGQRWAFFGLCIKGFAKTADTIKNERIREIYLDAWRDTQSFRLIRKMISLRLGLIRREPITFSTLKPLVSIKNPRTTILAAVLYFLAKCPAAIPQMAIASWSFTKSPKELHELNLAFISQTRSWSERYKLLRKYSNQQPQKK